MKYSIYLGDKTIQNQIKKCRELGIEHLEVSADLLMQTGADLKNSDVKFVAAVLQQPIEQTEIEKLQAVLSRCKALKIPYLMVGDFDKRSVDVEKIIQTAADFGVTLCFENLPNGYLNDPDRLNTFFRGEGKNCALCFNPVSFLRIKLHPFLSVFYAGRFKSAVQFVRMNDGIYKDENVVELPGQGSAEIKELISILQCRSFDGFLSVAPYGYRPEEVIGAVEELKSGI